MKVSDVYLAYRGPGRHYEVRRALTDPFSAQRVKASVMMGCITKQVQVLAYLFPEEAVDWISECNEGRVPDWLKRVR